MDLKVWRWTMWRSRSNCAWNETWVEATSGGSRASRLNGVLRSGGRGLRRMVYVSCSDKSAYFEFAWWRPNIYPNALNGFAAFIRLFWSVRSCCRALATVRCKRSSSR